MALEVCWQYDTLVFPVELDCVDIMGVEHLFLEAPNAHSLFLEAPNAHTSIVREGSRWTHAGSVEIDIEVW
jgi:hypothetical protein